MKSELHRADTRGHADHGWLKSHHTFSFARYYDENRMGFGALRVLNDDQVSGNMGFDTHPHQNMEIISIPLEGDLEHQDSMGNKKIIREGEIQVMSAGTGVMHSEYNHNPDKPVKFLQIWVIPDTMDVEPRYNQVKIADLIKPNEFSQILSPYAADQGVWIQQNAWFHLAEIETVKTAQYKLKDAANNGVYLFVLEGEVTVGEQTLQRRDGLAITQAESLDVTANRPSKVLAMEVPL